ncbi:MAG: elongation factor P [Rickettsiales bacterium]|jgi:elongation factor P|nr:elongation factor P [Rickettsiales bacterium]
MIANSLSIGNIIKHKDKLYTVVKKEHVKPGKGGAIIQVELKDIISGKKLIESFGSSEDVNRVILEETPYQYQYDDGHSLVFMNLENYETQNFDRNLLGEKAAYLDNGMEVTVCSCDNIIIEIKLPTTVVLGIKETESVVKGQTAASSFKPAVLENGLRVMVPQFITSDDKIIVKTEDSSYVERYMPKK